jgi:DNA-binding MarR family transcriptional regulator
VTQPDLVDETVTAWCTELPELAGLPLELGRRIIRLAAVFESAANTELERLGLTKAEHQVLARLRGAGPPYRGKPNELTKSLALSAGGTTNVLHRLAAGGLVSRETDPDDRRSSWVRLTANGVHTAEAAVLATNRAHAELLDRLPASIARALADLLRDTMHSVDGRPLTYRR